MPSSIKFFKWELQYVVVGFSLITICQISQMSQNLWWDRGKSYECRSDAIELSVVSVLETFTSFMYWHASLFLSNCPNLSQFSNKRWNFGKTWCVLEGGLTAKSSLKSIKSFNRSCMSVCQSLCCQNLKQKYLEAWSFNKNSEYVVTVRVRLSVCLSVCGIGYRI